MKAWCKCLLNLKKEETLNGNVVNGVLFFFLLVTYMSVLYLIQASSAVRSHICTRCVLLCGRHITPFVGIKWGSCISSLAVEHNNCPLLCWSDVLCLCVLFGIVHRWYWTHAECGASLDPFSGNGIDFSSEKLHWNFRKLRGVVYKHTCTDIMCFPCVLMILERFQWWMFGSHHCCSVLKHVEENTHRIAPLSRKTEKY